ncbi:RNA polymerase sigma factor [Stratiformator vulcanicus]|uniref:RNA polymerase sigma factor n=1 Tax=Stratiformator vulcanicus TaxID=2527980 RepID=UPI002878121E|nr:RNA polymerase sigma factor [Stratiformator vulcanicus]
MTSDESGLIRNCISGDERSCRLFVQKYQRLVFAICLRILGQRQDAEDAAQDIFLRIFRALDRWEPGRPLKPWLTTIAVNRCRTLLKKRQSESSRVRSVREVIEFCSPAATAADLAMAEELELALSKLRREYRLCFELYYRDEYSCVEIAEILDRPVNTVKTWLHRARRELADLLSRRGIAEEEGYVSVAS